MLIIRDEQMKVFKQYAEQNFVNSVVKQLRVKHAKAVKDLPEDKLYKRVEYGIQRAREYGFTWKNNLIAFVILMFEIAPDFDSYPAFQRYLEDKNLLPYEKMDLLLSETTDVDWLNARELSETHHWPEDIQ